MRTVSQLPALGCALILIVSVIHASLFSPFLSAIDSLSQIASNETSQDLFKRETDSTSCPTGYGTCSNLGAPGLCCASSAVCSADYAGHVACCPKGAACTGTISSIITGGTLAAGGTAVATTTNTGLVTTTAVTTTKTTSGNGLVLASAASSTTGATTGSTTQGFIIAASSTVATLGSGGVRNMHTPLIAQMIIGLLELLPL